MTRTTQTVRAAASLFICAGLLLLAAAAGWAQDPFAQMLAAAEGGDPRAQVRLGVAYATGNGAPVDGGEAVRWLERGATAGGKTGAVAAGWLGVIHERGIAVRKNGGTAVRWYTRGAELGGGASAQNLAEMYLAGKLVSKDEQLGLKWYARAAALYEVEAAAGDISAAYQAARIYDRRLGVPADRDRAIALLERATSGGHADATQLLTDIRARVRKGGGAASPGQSPLRGATIEARAFSSQECGELGGEMCRTG
jgi:TPR repeat protein